MVRIRIGRFAGELYYTATKAVVSAEERKRRIMLFAGHFGYFSGLAEYLMTDILLFRSAAVLGCGFIIAYQAAQPKIQPLFIFWNTLMGGVNLYYIYEMIKPPRDLSDEEANLFKSMHGRLTLNEFHKVLQAGTWRTFEKGEKLEQEAALYLIASGICDLLLDGCSLGPLGPGSVVGEEELFDHGASAGGSHPAPIPVAVAQHTVRCLCLPWEQLQSNGELMEALQGVLAATLVAKVITLSGGLITSQHSALQELAAGATDAETAALLGEAAREYGLRHGIPEPERHDVDSTEEQEAPAKAESEVLTFDQRMGVSRRPSGTEPKLAE